MTVVEALPEILMSVQHCRNNEQALDQLLKDSGIEFITQACVTVIDETPVRDPTLVEGDAGYLPQAVAASDDGQPWPSWRFGY